MKWLAHIAEVTVLVSKLGVRLPISSLPGCSEPWVWRDSGSGAAQARGGGQGLGQECGDIWSLLGHCLTL